MNIVEFLLKVEENNRQNALVFPISYLFILEKSKISNNLHWKNNDNISSLDIITELKLDKLHKVVIPYLDRVPQQPIGVSLQVCSGMKNKCS